MKLIIRVSVGLLLVLNWLVSAGQVGNHIVEYKSAIKIERGKKVEIKSYLIQIDNKASDWLSDIDIPYDEDDHLEILEASIIDPLGNTVRTLKKKEIITRSNISYGSFYEDDFIKEFKLKWHEYPYRIKYSYKTTTDQFLYVTKWYPYLYPSIYTAKASLRVELPQDYPVRISSSAGLNYQVDTTTQSYIYHWQASNLIPVKREVYSPPLGELLPAVTVVPENFEYAITGSFTSWASYGNWHAQLNEELDQLTTAEAMKVTQLVQGVTDQKEIIRILYHYMQDNTRYINVAIDVGGLKPYPASYVCQNKYGDCKALTIYMKALLKQAGIPSYYTVIHAGNNPVRINGMQPSQQFNHVILGVLLERDTVWLENTSQISPMNYLGTFTQDRNALWVNGENSRLIRTRPLTIEDVKEQNFYNFDIDVEGQGTVEIQKVLSGPTFERYNGIEEGYSLNEQKSILRNIVNLNNAEILDWSFNQPDRDEDRIIVNLNLELKNQYRKLGQSVVMRTASTTLIKFKSPAERKTPVRITYPINREDSMVYKINFSENYDIRLPEAISIASGYGLFEQSYQTIDNYIICKRKFQLNKGDYLPEDYPDLYTFFELIKQRLSKSVIIFNPI
jgi:hypothetical protein